MICRIPKPKTGSEGLDSTRWYSFDLCITPFTSHARLPRTIIEAFHRAYKSASSSLLMRRALCQYGTSPDVNPARALQATSTGRGLRPKGH